MSLEHRRILIVEDEAEIADLLSLHLRDLGADVVAAYDGDQGMAMVRRQPFDLAILDIQLPGCSGLQLCRALREQAHYTAIIMLTSRSTELDRVLGLEQGADDYITKPFSVMELLARIKAQCRRMDALAHQVMSQPKTAVGNELCIGSLVLDIDARTTYLDKKPVELTNKEFELLAHFARQPNRVFSRSELLDQVWGYGHAGYEHTVNSHINRLRNKIEVDPTQPSLIVTVWGVGYKLQPPA